MYELNSEEIQKISAGFLSNLEEQLGDKHYELLKTRSSVGLLAGVVLGINLTPGHLIISSIMGMVSGLSVGLAECWLWDIQNL